MPKNEKISSHKKKTPNPSKRFFEILKKMSECEVCMWLCKLCEVVVSNVKYISYSERCSVGS